jgi:LPXTG-site transpeptidase (sortase) family protein
MKKAMPWVSICTGIVLLIVAGGLFIYSRVDDFLAGQRAERVLQRVLDNHWELLEAADTNLFFSGQILSAEALENTNDEQLNESNNKSGSEDDIESNSEGNDKNEDGSDSEIEGAEAQIEYSVIGILEIPKLKKRLPVLDRSISALLNISVCRYSGRVEDKPVRLVVAGHNLKSHFGEISTLKIGDEIIFTTRDGKVIYYEMIGIDECHKSEEEKVQEGDDWDITLLTCKKDRVMRTLVRFAEMSK